MLGSLNGVLIARLKVPAVIATLGTLTAYRGLTFLITQGSQIDGNYIPKSLIRWSQIGPFGNRNVPWMILIVICIALLTWLILRYTRLGRHVYALGSNPDAARLRGVPVTWVTFFAHAFTGALSGFTGVLYAVPFRLPQPRPDRGWPRIDCYRRGGDRWRQRLWRLRFGAWRAVGLSAPRRDQCSSGRAWHRGHLATRRLRRRHPGCRDAGLGAERRPAPRRSKRVTGKGKGIAC